MSSGTTTTLGPSLRDWLHAFRLRTLPLAGGSILAGSGLAAFDGAFRPLVFGLALLTALLLQVLSNLANDLGDHLNGADNEHRIGPARAVQSGRITTAAMKRAMVLCALLALASGLGLLAAGTGLGASSGVFLLIGLAAIAAAVKYTYGSSPYGYAGLGDMSVLLFFGLAGVAGTHYLHTGAFRPTVLLPALAFGLWSTAVLNTNNMRDIRGDAANGKRTLAVRLGSERAKTYHGLLVVGGLACLVLFTALEFRGMPQWGFLITTPLLASHLRQVLANREPAALDPELKRLSLGTFFTAIAFAAGLMLA